MTDIYSELLEPVEKASRIYGMVIGVVTNLKDPEGLGRVKVKFPWLSEKDESHWARIVTPMAGKERGFYFLPEVDDEVLVAFEHGIAEMPYVVGALWNGKDKPPEKNDDGENNLRTIKSRSGHIIRLNDKKGEEKIEIIDSTAKNKITISTKDNTISIEADADVTIKSSKGKLVLQGKDVEIKSQAAVKIEASGNMDLKSNAQLNIKGTAVNIN
ncbi:MAG: phage baseplate assembly protein V [Methylotetracoccus sp.]|nr:phage baseplate assembly protein V [Methylotetracoccus sp.]